MKVRVWVSPRVVEIDEAELAGMESWCPEDRLPVALESLVKEDLRLEYKVLEQKP